MACVYRTGPLCFCAGHQHHLSASRANQFVRLLEMRSRVVAASCKRFSNHGHPVRLADSKRAKQFKLELSAQSGCQLTRSFTWLLLCLTRSQAEQIDTTLTCRSASACCFSCLSRSSERLEKIKSTRFIIVVFSSEQTKHFRARARTSERANLT